MAHSFINTLYDALKLTCIKTSAICLLWNFISSLFYIIISTIGPVEAENGSHRIDDRHFNKWEIKNKWQLTSTNKRTERMSKRCRRERWGSESSFGSKSSSSITKWTPKKALQASPIAKQSYHVTTFYIYIHTENECRKNSHILSRNFLPWIHHMREKSRIFESTDIS